MRPEETELFELLDDYSRVKHKCFLAEMFLSKDGTEYSLCFRPTGGSRESPRPLAYRYLRIGTSEARRAGRTRALSVETTDMLDRELSELARLTD